jgi:hypothetical protein
MNDHMPHDDNYPPAGGNGDEMESRLRRLESAIAAIADTKLMEDRLLQKVMDRVPPPAPPVATPAPPVATSQAGMLLDAGRAILPGALNVVGNELKSATDPRNAQASNSVLAPRMWLATDVIYELRSMWQMCFDHRFKPSWTVRIVPLTCVIIVIVNMLFLGGFFGKVLEYVSLILLSMLTYKTLSREATRYRQETAHLPPRI